MKKIVLFLKTSRAPFVVASAITVIYAAVIAANDGFKFNIPLFILALIGIVLIHLGANLLNDLYDYITGADDRNTNYTKFNGGSRAIQNGIFEPYQIFFMSALCLIFGIIIGLFLNYYAEGNVILIIGIIGVFCAIFYSASPIKFSYISLGELCILIAFGILPTTGMYYLFSGAAINYSTVILRAVPLGALVMLILYINEFPDYEADKEAHKNTLVVILNPENAVYLYFIIITIYFWYIIILWYLNIFSIFYLALFVTAPIAYKLGFMLKKNAAAANNNYIECSELMIKLHTLSGVIMIIAAMLS